MLSFPLTILFYVAVLSQFNRNPAAFSPLGFFMTFLKMQSVSFKMIRYI